MAYIPGAQKIAQRVQGNAVSQQFTIGSGSPGFIVGGPTVTITAQATGLYRVYVDCSLYSNGGDFQAGIGAISGSPIFLEGPAPLVQTVAFSTARLEVIVMLTAGSTYTFGVATTSGSGGFFLMEANSGPNAMMAEQIL